MHYVVWYWYSKATRVIISRNSRSIRHALLTTELFVDEIKSFHLPTRISLFNFIYLFNYLKSVSITMPDIDIPIPHV
jgi:hypothetical protein